MTRKENPLLIQQRETMRKRGYITPDEASAIFKTPKQTIYTWVREKAVEVQRVGRRKVYVSVVSLRKLVGTFLSPAA